MKRIISTSLLALAFTTQALAAPGPVTDFRLPPAPTPTATPRVQGPVDTEGASPTAPRVIPTEAPTPTRTPTPAATQTAAPTPAPTAAPTRAAQPTPRATRSTAPQVRPQVTTPTTTSTPAPLPTGAVAADFPDNSSLLPSDLPSQLPTSPAPIEAQSGFGEAPEPTNYTLWIALIVALVVALGAALAFWPRRRAATAGVPEIEPPSKWVSSSSDAADLPPLPSSPPPLRERPSDEPEAVEPPLVAAAGAQSDDKSALQIKVQALTLSRSLMNATLSYRLELMNLKGTQVSEISVKADVVTAHGQAPISEQVADEYTQLVESAFVAAIEARETHEAKGSFSLPVNSIRLITQRGAKLYVPLLRLRVEAINMDPIICTFVVGIKPPERGAKLQPFRLDELAQTYRNIGLRLLD